MRAAPEVTRPADASARARTRVHAAAQHLGRFGGAALVAAWVVGGGLRPAHAETAAEQAARIQRRQAAQGLTSRVPAPPSGQLPAPPAPGSGRTGGACIPIRKVDVSGVHLLGAAEIARVIAPFEGRCLGLAQMNGVLRAVTFAYVRRGWVAARAYLPEQNLATGTLRVAVVEGRLAEITVNGSASAAAGEKASAFPGMLGRPLNLRDIEQGLDQISRLPGVDAHMAIAAGAKPGQSVLAVTRKAGPRVTGDAGSDNLGGRSTGLYESHLNLGIADPLGRNDLLSLGYQRSMAASPLHVSGRRPYGDDYSAGYELPWGYWTFAANASRLSYRSQLAAALGPIPTSGTTETLALSAARVLTRDQLSKTRLTATLTWSSTRSYILGSLIDVSSYRLAVLRLELAQERRIWGGAGRLALGLSRGLPVLGAVDDHGAAAGAPQGQFTALHLAAHFARMLRLGGTLLSYDGALRAQWSNDRLFSSQQMSLGGPGTVRGLRAAALFGNRAALLRQSLGVPLIRAARLGPLAARALGRLDLYGALDAGHVWSQPDAGIAGGMLVGVAAGLRSRGGPLGLDLSYSRIISRSAGLSLNRNGMIAASVSMTF